MSLPILFRVDRLDSPILVLSRDVQFSGWAVFLEGNWNVESFVTNYLPFALFPVLYIGGKLWLRAPLVKLEEMDLVSGLKEIEAECYDEPPPRNWVERFWAWLVSVLPYSSQTFLVLLPRG